jgi:hypothetical protein
VSGMNVCILTKSGCLGGISNISLLMLLTRKTDNTTESLNVRAKSASNQLDRRLRLTRVSYGNLSSASSGH